MSDIVVLIKKSFNQKEGPMAGSWYKDDEHRRDNTPELRDWLKNKHNKKFAQELPDKSRRKKESDEETSE